MAWFLLMDLAALDSVGLAVREQILELETVWRWLKWGMLHRRSVVGQVIAPLVDLLAVHLMPVVIAAGR